MNVQQLFARVARFIKPHSVRSEATDITPEVVAGAPQLIAFIVDLKWTAEGPKILEFGSVNESGFKGYDNLPGHVFPNNMYQRVIDTVEEWRDKVDAAGYFLDTEHIPDANIKAIREFQAQEPGQVLVNTHGVMELLCEQKGLLPYFFERSGQAKYFPKQTLLPRELYGKSVAEVCMQALAQLGNPDSVAVKLPNTSQGRGVALIRNPERRLPPFLEHVFTGDHALKGLKAGLSEKARKWAGSHEPVIVLQKREKSLPVDMNGYLHDLSAAPAESYDGTMRIVFTGLEMNGKLELKPVDAYWKIPKESYSSSLPLEFSARSEIMQGDKTLPMQQRIHSAPVPPQVLTLVSTSLIPPLTAFMQEMLNTPLPQLVHTLIHSPNETEALIGVQTLAKYYNDVALPVNDPLVDACLIDMFQIPERFERHEGYVMAQAAIIFDKITHKQLEVKDTVPTEGQMQLTATLHLNIPALVCEYLRIPETIPNAVLRLAGSQVTDPMEFMDLIIQTAHNLPQLMPKELYYVYYFLDKAKPLPPALQPLKVNAKNLILKNAERALGIHIEARDVQDVLHALCQSWAFNMFTNEKEKAGQLLEKAFHIIQQGDIPSILDVPVWAVPMVLEPPADVTISEYLRRFIDAGFAAFPAYVRGGKYENIIWAQTNLEKIFLVYDEHNLQPADNVIAAWNSLIDVVRLYQGENATQVHIDFLKIETAEYRQKWSDETLEKVETISGVGLAGRILWALISQDPLMVMSGVSNLVQHALHKGSSWDEETSRLLIEHAIGRMLEFNRGEKSEEAEYISDMLFKLTASGSAIPLADDLRIQCFFYPHYIEYFHKFNFSPEHYRTELMAEIKRSIASDEWEPAFTCIRAWYLVATGDTPGISLQTRKQELEDLQNSLQLLSQRLPGHDDLINQQSDWINKEIVEVDKKLNLGPDL